MAKAKEAVKSFVLRIDSETMEALERWAASEFRSTNGQLQYIINEALRKNGRLKKKIQEHHQHVSGFQHRVTVRDYFLVVPND